jgi:hypothetical protein
MTKTEKRNAITSALCKHITKHYPDLEIEESEGGRLNIYDTNDPNLDNGIEYSRSSFTFATYNWASDNTKQIEQELEAYVNSLLKHYEI